MRQTQLVLLMCVLLTIPGAALAQTEWTIDSGGPVLELGEPGSWEDAGQAVAAVLFDGSVYHMWYEGWDVAGEHDDIGHATSPDGVTWTKDPANPVLSRGEAGEWDSLFMWGLGVVYDGTQYRMWYGGFGGQARTYQGGYATSPDGTAWTKYPDNPVLTPGPDGSWDDDGVRPHTVMLEGGTYRMWYAGWNDAVGQVGYAESTDGVAWTNRPNPVLEVGKLPGAWDSDYALHPYVVSDGTTYHMFFTGSDGSSVSEIGHAFSSDGIVWAKYRGNPVLGDPDRSVFGSPVIFDGTTFHMWYTVYAAAGNHWEINHATSDCCTGPPAYDRQVIPAAAYAAGAEGSFYETTLELNNAGVNDADVRFLWLPRGESNTEPMESEPFTVGAGHSVRYDNVLADVFNLEPDVFGALGIESTNESLLAVARIANTPQEPGAGSFGQPLDAIRTFDCTDQNEKRRLLFGTEHAEMRFNVGCFNASDQAAQVTFELHRANGALLATEVLDLPAWGNDQINRIFDPYHPVTGYVDYWSNQPSGLVYCYGSVLDNVTSDPTTIPPM
ncbi:MAG: hypothetical protein AB1Z65_01615 [Candidatus Sulfomarinibacteraceae bacterium]